MQSLGLRPLVAGNWKMNGLTEAVTVLDDIAAGYGPDLKDAVELLVCPPATLVALFAETARLTAIAIGGQDCHAEDAGAHTGDIAAPMLADLGATHVIVGHSERRAHHGESDAAVRAKARAAMRTHLIPIVCVGETRAQREAGDAIDVVTQQLRGSLPEDATGPTAIIAYEPIWAIGTGLVPSPSDIAEMHAAIRRELVAIVRPGEAAGIRILYGGSVKPSNAAELLAIANVDGALVGGASLVAADFLGIASAYLR